MRLAVAHPPAWHTRAACAGHNPNLWFPDPGGPGRAQTRRAKAICHTCPVQTDCLAAAMAAEGALVAARRGGVWGGLTPEERARLAGLSTARVDDLLPPVGPPRDNEGTTQDGPGRRSNAVPPGPRRPTKEVD